MQTQRAHVTRIVLIAALGLFVRTGPVAGGDDVKILKGHTSGVIAVAFSPDGQTLASASVGDTIKLWDVKSGALRRTLYGNSGDVSVIVFSRDSKILATGGENGDVTLWELGTGRACAAPSGECAKVCGLAFALDDAWLAAGDAQRTIRLWSPKLGKLQATLEGHGRAVLGLAFSPDGKMLASGGAEGDVKIWNLERQHEVTPAALRQRARRGPIMSTEFSPDGRELAIAARDVVEVWDVLGLQRQLEFAKRPKGVLWWSVHYSSQARLIAIGTGAKYVRAIRVSTKKVSAGSWQPEDRVIRLWDVKAGQEIARLAGHHDSVRAVALSPDGTLLASGSKDKTVRIWDLAKNRTSTEQFPARQVAESNVDDGGLPAVINGEGSQAECLKELQMVTNAPPLAVTPSIESREGEQTASNGPETPADGSDDPPSLLMDGISLLLENLDRGSLQPDASSNKAGKNTVSSDRASSFEFHPLALNPLPIEKNSPIAPLPSQISAARSTPGTSSGWEVFRFAPTGTFTHGRSTGSTASDGSSAGASETFHYFGGSGGSGDHGHGGGEEHKKK